MSSAPRLGLLRLCGIADDGLARAAALKARYEGALSSLRGVERERIEEILDSIELVERALAEVRRVFCSGPDYSFAEAVRVQNMLNELYTRIMYMSASTPTVLKHIYYEVLREVNTLLG